MKEELEKRKEAFISVPNMHNKPLEFNRRLAVIFRENYSIYNVTYFNKVLPEVIKEISCAKDIMKELPIHEEKSVQHASQSVLKQLSKVCKYELASCNFDHGHLEYKELFSTFLDKVKTICFVANEAKDAYEMQRVSLFFSLCVDIA